MVSLGANLFSYNRLAYHAFVTGNPDQALGWMSQAIQAGSRSPENEAWCLSEMGDMLFKTGHMKDAEFAFNRALQIFPGYHRAYAGKGRVEAANGRNKEAIEAFQHAQAVVPLPEYTGTLISLYQAAGDKQNAARQQALLNVADKLMTANNEKANRNLALIYADLDTNLAHALDLTNAEFEVRHDVYSYDALSWALYKNGKLSEAKDASEKALALNTPEPTFYFHAGMIALAVKDYGRAKQQLEKAIAMNPNFDVRNGVIARSSLSQLN
jgi:tetratricopeptide (TPR) repeat protein